MTEFAGLEETGGKPEELAGRTQKVQVAGGYAQLFGKAADKISDRRCRLKILI